MLTSRAISRKNLDCMMLFHIINHANTYLNFNNQKSITYYHSAFLKPPNLLIENIIIAIDNKVKNGV
jgi:hypothetical protein